MSDTQTPEVEIRYLRGSYQFNRPVLQAQLFNCDTNARILDGTLHQLLTFCNEKNLKLRNAQEILNEVVIRNGFAS